MDVVNEGRDSKATEMFDLADDLSLQVFELKQKLERIKDTLDRLLEFRPEFDDDQDEDEQDNDLCKTVRSGRIHSLD